MLCAYCGKNAEFILKNGKYCCKQFSVQCEVNKQKNSSGLKKAHSDGKMPSNTFGSRKWNKGKTIFSDERVKRTYSKEEYFCEQSKVNTGAIKNIIVKEKLLPYCCEQCNNTGQWLNKVIVLELDHKNGNNKDNRIENLRFLCPNCHSQTTNFKGKNINSGKIKISDIDLIQAIKETDNIFQALTKVGLSGGGNYKRAYKLFLTMIPTPSTTRLTETQSDKTPKKD